MQNSLSTSHLIVGFMILFLVFLLGFGLTRMVVASRALKELELSIRNYSAASVSLDIMKRFRKRLELVANTRTPGALVDEAVSVVEDYLESKVFWARFIGNAGVYLGLLGALIGLAASAVSIRSDSGQTVDKQLGQILTSSQEMISGFGWAFGAAIAGLVTTLFLNLLLTRYDRRSETCLDLLQGIALESIGGITESTKRDDPLAAIREPITRMADAVAPLANQIARLNESQIEFARRHEAFVASSAKNLREVTDAAIESFSAQLVEVADVYSEIRRDVLQASQSSQAEFKALVEATQIASREIVASITANEMQRKELESNIVGLAEAADVIKGSLSSMRENLDGYAKLTDVVRDISGNLNSLTGEIRTLSADFRSSLQEMQSQNTSDVDRARQSIAASTEKVVEIVDRHQRYAELLQEAIYDIPQGVMLDRLILLPSEGINSQLDLFSTKLDGLYSGLHNLREHQDSVSLQQTTVPGDLSKRLDVIEFSLHKLLQNGGSVSPGDGENSKSILRRLKFWKRDR
jgi:hypothetical protein